MKLEEQTPQLGQPRGTEPNASQKHCEGTEDDKCQQVIRPKEEQVAYEVSQVYENQNGVERADAPGATPSNGHAEAEGNGNDAAATQDQNVAARVHISNLPFTLRNTELRKLFEPYGTVIEAEIVYNDKGSRGYGFVSMSSAAEAELAQKSVAGMMVEGRTIHVNPAVSRHHQRDNNTLYPRRFQNSHMSELSQAEALDRALKNLPQLPGFPGMSFFSAQNDPHTRTQLAHAIAVRSIQVHAQNWARHLLQHNLTFGITYNSMNLPMLTDALLLSASASTPGPPLGASFARLAEQYLAVVAATNPGEQPVPQPQVTSFQQPYSQFMPATKKRRLQ
uniref:RRM domain-containing protein n=1 Tax=Steinernema glaseri TaxID=37863 RepID=A0A1I8AB19_9BILA